MRPCPPSTDPTDPGYQRQDQFSRGLGVAAQAIGLTTDVFRPATSCASAGTLSTELMTPLAACNRVVRLHAAFTGADAQFKRPPGYGDAIWYGLFDVAYTCSGDYLRQNEDVWFIASQPRLMPALCVLTDRTVTFTRPVTTRTIGAAAYSGVQLGSSQLLLCEWPASIIGAKGTIRTEARLPADGGMAEWVVLLPATAGVALASGDLMLDDLGRRGVIAAAELSDLGWRLAVHQAVP